MKPVSAECARSDMDCDTCPRSRQDCACKCHIPKPPRWRQTFREMKK